MNKETFEALKTITKGTRTLLNEKYGQRKRLNQNELWEKATLTRDIVKIEEWIKDLTN